MTTHCASSSFSASHIGDLFLKTVLNKVVPAGCISWSVGSTVQGRLEAYGWFFSVYENHPEDCWKQMFVLPPAEFQIQKVWGGAPEFLLLTRSQKLLVQEADSEDLCLGMCVTRETKEVNAEGREILGKCFGFCFSFRVCMFWAPVSFTFLLTPRWHSVYYSEWVKCQLRHQTSLPQKIKDLYDPGVWICVGICLACSKRFQPSADGLKTRMD